MTPDDAAVGGHYSSVARIGDLLFTAGHVPRDRHRKIIGHNIEEQTAAVLQNIEATLKLAGAVPTDIFQVRVYLTDLRLAGRFNDAYSAFFGSHRPVRTVVGARLNEVLVEIDVAAAIGGAG
ncbi:RidA family protein [Castellaniella sp.]|uniref:RidA family protein n=1 Tax=Castellaniella sp. TaxID=1955812 RepID=UPI0025C52D83|nr:RidA family protein [Castellaniella sp.]